MRQRHQAREIHRHPALSRYRRDSRTEGAVVYVGSQLKGFTFGEPLGASQSSITIEKTDLTTKGLAQFIFSEFCRSCWADRPLVNVGDDWGLETLAWTKQSYRPVKMLQKFVLRATKRSWSRQRNPIQA